MMAARRTAAAAAVVEAVDKHRRAAEPVGVPPPPPPTRMEGGKREKGVLGEEGPEAFPHVPHQDPSKPQKPPRLPLAAKPGSGAEKNQTRRVAPAGLLAGTQPPNACRRGGGDACLLRLAWIDTKYRGVVRRRFPERQFLRVLKLCTSLFSFVFWGGCTHSRACRSR
ncbi:unnamed protein product [Ectocarpus sp. 4 AP-2014]